jgi:hypothetical protein
LDLLAFLQAAKAICLDGGVMHEYIFPTLTADKAKALRIVKPLYCSLFHVALIPYLLMLRVEMNRKILQAGTCFVKARTAHNRF